MSPEFVAGLNWVSGPCSTYFIELPSADFAVDRVRVRVAAGGHSIPQDVIRRRFDRGIRLFDELYKKAFDVTYHWFSDEDGLRLLRKHSAI